MKLTKNDSRKLLTLNTLIEGQLISGIKPKIMHKPLLDKVLVTPRKQEGTTTAAGLFLQASKDILEGTVIAVGSGKKDEPMTLIPEDTVVWKRGSGTVFEDNVILAQSEILMVTS